MTKTEMIAVRKAAELYEQAFELNQAERMVDWTQAFQKVNQARAILAGMKIATKEELVAAGAKVPTTPNR